MSVPDEDWEKLKTLGPARALLGCSWGFVVASEDDPDVCEEQAVQIVVMHEGESSFDIRLCQRHLDIVLANTTPTNLCTMCEERPATTNWGLPVCQTCADWLTNLDVDLKQMEAEDPELAAAGERFEAVVKEYLDGRD